MRQNDFRLSISGWDCPNEECPCQIDSRILGIDVILELFECWDKTFWFYNVGNEKFNLAFRCESQMSCHFPAPHKIHQSVYNVHRDILHRNASIIKRRYSSSRDTFEEETTRTLYLANWNMVFTNEFNKYWEKMIEEDNILKKSILPRLAT